MFKINAVTIHFRRNEWNIMHNANEFKQSSASSFKLYWIIFMHLNQKVHTINRSEAAYN